MSKKIVNLIKIVMASAVLFASVLYFNYLAGTVDDLRKENVQLKKEIEENETSRSGGLEISLEKPELKEKFIPTEDDPSFFPLPYNNYLRETSPWGVRTSPITGNTVSHLGWDICGRTNSEVYAAGDGVVVDLWLPKGTIVNGITYKGHPTRDGYIVIDHGRFTTTYSHLSYVTVYSIGTVVKEGQIIGRTGSGGLATGDHLHFELIDNETKTYVDPIEIFPYLYIDSNHKIWFEKENIVENPISTF